MSPACLTLSVAFRLQTYLAGKAWSTAVLQGALAALTKDIDAAGDSTAPGQTPAYRRQLAAAFLYKFALRSLPSVPPSLQSAAQRYVRPVSSGTEVFAPDKMEYPISQPIVKLSALEQTSGEAMCVRMCAWRGVAFRSPAMFALSALQLHVRCVASG